MKIQVVSDLHLEFQNPLPPLADGVDVLVCAGDLAPIGTDAVIYADEQWVGAQILYVARGLDAATGLREPRGLFRRAPRGIAGVVESYELALRRVDRMLSRFGVERLKTTGHPFDSRTMQAMEVRRVEQAGHGVVVEELLSGFTREGDVLRLADVAVNRLDTQE